MNTKAAGYAAITPNAATIRERVTEIFSGGDYTDNESHELYRLGWGEILNSTVRARRRELVLSGVLRDTGERRANVESGIPNILWGKVAA